MLELRAITSPAESLDAPLALSAAAGPALPVRRSGSRAALDETALVFEGAVAVGELNEEHSNAWLSSDSDDSIERWGGDTKNATSVSKFEVKKDAAAAKFSVKRKDRRLPLGVRDYHLATAMANTAAKTLHLKDLGRFIRTRLAKLLAWVWFDRIMLFMIFASCIFLALDVPNLDPQSRMGVAQVGGSAVEVYCGRGLKLTLTIDLHHRMMWVDASRCSTPPSSSLPRCLVPRWC